MRALTMSIDRISSDGYRPKESYERTSGNLYFEYAFNPVLNLDFQWLAYSSDLGVLTGDERYWAGEPSGSRHVQNSGHRVCASSYPMNRNGSFYIPTLRIN